MKKPNAQMLFDKHELTAGHCSIVAEACRIAEQVAVCRNTILAVWGLPGLAADEVQVGRWSPGSNGF